MPLVSATFTAELPSLRKIQEFLRKSARTAKFSAEDLNRLDLVIEEIAVNVCRYAYRDTDERPLKLDVEVSGQGEIQVCVADRGVPFSLDMAPVPNLNAALRDRPIGGLGVFLVNHLALDISYRRAGGWNFLGFRFAATPGPK